MESEKVLSSNGQLPSPRQIICKKQTTAEVSEALGGRYFFAFE
jgi:hypothetical protein